MILGYTLLEWAQIFSAFTVVPSLALVILYWKMAKTQKRQTEIQEQQAEIMDRQNRLMAASHKPDIRFNSNDIQVNGNEVAISLTNVGNGPAKHLRLRCDARYYSESSDQIAKESSTNPLKRVYTTSRQSMNRGFDEESLEPEDTILTEKKDIKFSSNILLAVPSQNKETPCSIPFDRGITELIEEDVKYIRIHLFLIFEDITGDKEENQLQSIGRYCKIEKDMQLEDIVEQGSHSSYGGTITVEPKSWRQKILALIK